MWRAELGNSLLHLQAYVCLLTPALSRESVRAEMEAKKRQAEAEEAAAAAAAAAAPDGPPASKRAKVQGISQEVLDDLTAVSTELSKGRKKRQIPENTATVGDLEGYGMVGSFPLHKTIAGGILSLDLQPDKVRALGGFGPNYWVGDYRHMGWWGH